MQNSCKGSRQKAGEKMGEVIVSMKDIVKTFPGVKALDHVNFELRSGEVMALLGENGAGKSTLMKILSGVYTKDSGTMTIFGTEYENLTPKQAQTVGVAIHSSGIKHVPPFIGCGKHVPWKRKGKRDRLK